MKGLLLGLALLLPWLARADEWRETLWQGEPAWTSSAGGWRAVVSRTRARLMHFGPEHSEVNLLHAPPAPTNHDSLGGHRLWLGPQAQWPGGDWPPPAAWEYREPAAVAVVDGVLRLTMLATHDDWPQLTRSYHWDGAVLVCGAAISGGHRPVQIVQIFQVPTATKTSVTVHPEQPFPRGYVRLFPSDGLPATPFPLPVQAALAGATLTLSHSGTIGKYGFRPQPLIGSLDGCLLTVDRGALTGEIVGQPDEGFHTQVYLSNRQESFVELEQLTPLFAAGQPANFEVRLSGRVP